MANATIMNDHQIVVTLPEASTEARDYRLVSKENPDIPIALSRAEKNAAKPGEIILTASIPVDAKGSYILSHHGAEMVIAPSMIGTVLTVLLSAALVQNFVFTRYLGLCVFFGVSRRRETAIGMGVTFTLVGLLSGFLAWVVDRFLLHPFHLQFLQIIIFIGIIACLVQMVDTIMKKVNRPLHKKFGIYVVLITTNCIILAVPLLNAMSHTGLWASLALALGAGLGFALALFLMSCARERADIAPVPAIFRGLPIAFILAGLFALAFLGFSGLKV
jgi:electron transport complex protein RnfA